MSCTLWVCVSLLLSAALPNDVLESGLYDGNVKSSLIMPYMEAVQRRMMKKGWTKEQLLAIQKSFDVGLQRESIIMKHPEILANKGKSHQQLEMMANVAVLNGMRMCHAPRCLHSLLEAAVPFVSKAACFACLVCSTKCAKPCAT